MLTRAIQQIIFTANLDRTRNTTAFFIIEKAKKKKTMSKIFLKEF